MKATCSIEKMKNAVSYTERITGKNVTLPVLSSILITAHEDSLVFRSTNLSIGVEVTIPAKVETVGKVLIPGDVLSSTISNLVDVKKSTTLEIVNGNLVLSTSHGSVTVKGVPDDDFPTIPTVEGETLSIPSKILLEGIRSVFYSASPSDIRPEISSVYLYSEEDLLVFVATDSFRLAEKKIKIKGLSTVNGIIIPLKNTQEIVRILGDFDTTVLVSFSKNQISFSFSSAPSVSFQFGPVETSTSSGTSSFNSRSGTCVINSRSSSVSWPREKGRPVPKGVCSKRAASAIFGSASVMRCSASYKSCNWSMYNCSNEVRLLLKIPIGSSFALPLNER